AVINHLEPGIARFECDLFGSVGMAIEAGLADQHLEWPAVLARDLIDPRPRCAASQVPQRRRPARARYATHASARSVRAPPPDRWRGCRHPRHQAAATARTR